MTPEEVDIVVEDADTSEAAKLDRLYLEVDMSDIQYCIVTVYDQSTILPEREAQYKKLTLQIYQKTSVYLKKVSCAASTIWKHFDNALSRLNIK